MLLSSSKPLSRACSAARSDSLTRAAASAGGRVCLLMAMSGTGEVEVDDAIEAARRGGVGPTGQEVRKGELEG